MVRTKESTIENELFPFECSLSLKPLIDFWRTLLERESNTGALGSFNRDVLVRLQEVPELEGPAVDIETVMAHQDLVDALMSAIFPRALEDRAIGAAYAPFSWRRIYTTPAFYSLLAVNDHCPIDQNREIFLQRSIMSAYHRILQHLYGIEITWDTPPIIEVPNKKTGLSRFYKLTVENRFMEIEAHGQAKELTEEEIDALLDEPNNLELWRSILPPDSITFRGFLVLYGVDVTEEQSLSLLKDDLLQKDAMASPEKLDHLQTRVQTLLGQPDLQLGLVALERSEADSILRSRPIGRSLLLRNGVVPDCTDPGSSIYAKAVGRRKPVVIRNLNMRASCASFESFLLESGMNSLLLAPLWNEDGQIGLLELGSTRRGGLSALSAVKLENVLSLFATALRRAIDEREDRVQAVIKQHYTSIHPVVEWRFRQAALNYIEKQERAGRTFREREIEPIVFRDVIPLYGLSDIRDSSTRRNEALRADLAEQIDLARKVLQEAYAQRGLPVLGEVNYRLEKSRKELENMLSVEHESSVLKFLQERVEPLFDELKTFGPTVEQAIREYREALDADLGFIYRQRKSFEESVARINHAISTYLEEQEREAQKLFPHYFELYKTDGVDYNIYAGSSLLENGHFTDMMMQSLRIWQLITMSGVVRVLNELESSLPVHLQTAHLLLVHTVPFSIRFRQEEKQFDADGAYNIRYEITKKRIDKALIKGTGERVTHPGKIAVVYTSAGEASEYEQYFEYLQKEGYLEDEVEQFELEEMPGAYGLRAFRVTVRAKSDTTKPRRDEKVRSVKTHPGEYTSGDGDRVNEPAELTV